MSSATRASACAPADVEAWLTDLGLEPLERADRGDITSWDLILDGRRRAGLRVTLILDPALALICWAHFAPPINDSFRRSYRTLLRWNDDFPFVKFSIGEDERPLLIAEIPPGAMGSDALGLALARQVAVADRCFAETTEWLKAGGWSVAPATPPADGAPPGPGQSLLARYSTELAELLDGAPSVAVAGPAVAGPAVAAPAVGAPNATGARATA